MGPAVYEPKAWESFAVVGGTFLIALVAVIVIVRLIDNVDDWRSRRQR